MCSENYSCNNGISSQCWGISNLSVSTTVTLADVRFISNFPIKEA